MRQVIDELERIRFRCKLMLLVQRSSTIVAVSLGVILLLVPLDYALRFPGPMRLIILLLGLATLVHVLWRDLRPALRFWPTLTQLALRAERSLPQLAGRLASSVEFSATGLDETNALAARTVQETTTRLTGASLRSVMRSGRMLGGMSALVTVLLVLVFFVSISPASASTGLRRILLPLGDAAWPARTGVESRMTEVVGADFVHARGQALLLRAAVTRGPADQDVEAQYRLRKQGTFGSWTTVVLTHQHDVVHERLVDVDGEAIELFFETADASSRRETIKLIAPPAIIRAGLLVTPPAYASGRYPPLDAELGPGVDQRAVTERPSLVGSTVELMLELNKPLPVPAGAERTSWLIDTLGWGGDGAPMFAVDDQNPHLWSLRWRLSGDRSLFLTLVDEYGLLNVDQIAYRIDAVEDRLPAVTMTQPQADEAVLPTAMFDLAAEADDDVALGQLALEAHVQRSGEVAPNPTADWSVERAVDAARATIEEPIDLTPLGLVEGDVVHVTGLAHDIFELDGQTHEVARSAARKLHVISALDLSTQLRQQLGTVRQNAIRVEGQQSELQDDIIDDGVQPGVDRAQAMVGERIGDQAAALEDIERRMLQNRLDDSQLADLLRQAQDMLDYAGRASSQASEAIDTRQREVSEQERDQQDARVAGEESEPRETDEADRPIVEAQQAVRDELADLIELLDRNEDTWVVTERLQGLLEDQASLTGQTGQLAEQTIGRDRDELSEIELSELDRIAARQQELADRARDLIDEMRDRAEALEEVDPRAAGGMRSAADTGEQEQVDREMDRAAQQAQQNQLQTAGASQQAAMQSLQRMIQDMEETDRARVEELARQLASLVESIERLITVQENEIIALARALDQNSYTGRDRAMIRLNQNTLAVAGEARATGQEARRIARLLDRAADAQGAAVTSLRAQPVDHAGAQAAEDRSLEQLLEAKKLAEEMQEQAGEQALMQQREELIEQYRAFLERQVTLQGDTAQLAGIEELTRRQLVTARRLGTTQEDIRRGLDDLRAVTQELAQALVFSHVHDQINRWANQVSEAMREGEVSIDVLDHQQLIADSIGRLIDALQDLISPPEEFAQEGEAGGGAGSGASSQQPLIPPVTELRLLRGLQEQVYNQTRDLDGRGDLDAAQRRQRLRDIGGQQRDLQQLGEQMMETLQQNQQPPGPPETDEE